MKSKPLNLLKNNIITLINPIVPSASILLMPTNNPPTPQTLPTLK